MYYYGGYQGYGSFPNGTNYNNTGYGYSGAIILVLFILLVIVIGAKAFDNNNGRR